MAGFYFRSLARETLAKSSVHHSMLVFDPQARIMCSAESNDDGQFAKLRGEP
jgi:hypothetical protein